jgi:hypothetical protein
MQITTAQLNEVAGLLGTADKNEVFSAVLGTLTANGIAADAAFDTLFGQGAYQRFAGEVYEALRAA